MPNAFLRPERITATALEMLRRELILPNLVTRMGLADFRGAKDDTVNVRVQAILSAREYEWRTRTNPIVLDEIVETSIPVTLDKHPYSAVAVTDEELTLDIVSFGEQVLAPQVTAVAEKLESYIAAVMETAPYASAVTYIEGSSAAAFYEALVDANKALNDQNVPKAGRIALIGSTLEAAALKEDSLRAVDQSGSSSALRDAIIGQAAGFLVVATNSLPTDFGVAFHRSAFAFANVAPEVPSGVPFGSSQTEAGLAMRWIRDYDPNYLRDRSVVSSFAGAASVDDGRDPDSPGGTPGDLNGTNIRAVRIDFTPAGS